MQSKIYLIANWKCNPKSKKQANHLLVSLKKDLNNKSIQVVVCPPFIYLSKALKIFENKITVGAQNCHFEPTGAFTGEISASMLQDLGCQYVILGHSERRKYFKETDKQVNKKIKIALKNRLYPILCVGEQARDSFTEKGEPINEMSLIVGEQLEKALFEIPKARLTDILIAYEPIWAIGTGDPCSAEDAMKAKLFIRKKISELYDRKTAEKTKILYGGSIDSKNAKEYIQQSEMNGLLVGGASLNASEFSRIIKKILK